MGHLKSPDPVKEMMFWLVPPLAWPDVFFAHSHAVDLLLSQIELRAARAVDIPAVPDSFEDTRSRRHLTVISIATSA